MLVVIDSSSRVLKAVVARSQCPKLSILGHCAISLRLMHADLPVATWRLIGALISDDDLRWSAMLQLLGVQWRLSDREDGRLLAVTVTGQVFARLLL